MKYLRLIPVALVFASATVLATSNTIYADIQLTDIAPTSGFIWQRKNQHTPKYPVELASAGMQGCTVLSFDISESGRAQNIEVVQSVPNQHLGKYARLMLKRWHWVPVSSTTTAVAEKRTLRLDFCMGGDSLAQSEQACKRQAQLACS